MLRLAHRILDQAKSGIEAMPGVSDSLVKSLVQLVASDECSHIVADNVLAYIHDQAKNNVLFVEYDKHFSNLAPPFEMCFIEASHEGLNFKQLGWMVIAIDARTDPRFNTQKQAGCRWVIALYSIVVESNGRCIFTGDYCSVGVRGDGSFHGVGLNDGWLCQATQLRDLTGEEGKMSKLGSIFGTPLMAINFMNCRNTTLVNVTKSEGPSKKWLQRRRQKGLTYRTVTIDPEKPKRGHSVSSREGIPTEKRSFHICRGHFITYTDANGSKGLFGKGIYGTFWVPSHPVGDKKHGQTITTYKVKVPK